MYAHLWHRLPGPTWVRALIFIAAAAAILAACFTWVFPAVLGIIQDTGSGIGPNQVGEATAPAAHTDRVATTDL